MKKINKITTIVLLASFVFYMIMPFANAADNYSISISGASSSHEYGAWQVFSGDVSEGDVGEAKLLSNIKWGSGVDGSGLLTALKADDTLGTHFASIDDSDPHAAANVAKVLEGFDTDSTEMRKFAELVSQHLNGDATKKSTYVTDHHEINDLPAGYYFIKDTKEIEANEAATRYILKVTNGVEIKVKADVPTLEKQASLNGENFKDATSAEIGSVVSFTLTGTLPDVYEDYKSYKFIFTDVIPAGLDFTEGSVKVEVLNGEDRTDITSQTSVNTYEKPNLRVGFDDLKTLNGVKIDKDSQIIVTYSTTVNAQAGLGNVNGNTNKASLEFSNDPNSDGEGKTSSTPTETSTVYTYELDVNKVDGKSNQPLDGVKFKLYKNDSGSIKYAVLNEDMTLKEWTDSEDAATVIVTKDGGKLSVKGLKAGTYYLKEIETLDGYNLIDDLTLSITEVLSEDGQLTQQLQKLSISVNGGEATDGDIENGVVSITVQNNKGSLLPSTGGIGTIIFYVAGAGLVALSIVIIVKKKSKSNLS